MRRHLDTYFTPKSAVLALLPSIPHLTSIFECCNGDGDISDVFLDSGFNQVMTNDIQQFYPADHHFDATDPLSWHTLKSKGVAMDFVVTNPPYTRAAEIVPLAYEHCTIGMAMLLRLSWLEPCANRRDWLRKYPPTELIVLPRISFTGNGKTDSVTCAWMIWNKAISTQKITIF